MVERKQYPHGKYEFDGVKQQLNRAAPYQGTPSFEGVQDQQPNSSTEWRTPECSS
jgi:hypothetical protein